MDLEYFKWHSTDRIMELRELCVSQFTESYDTYFDKLQVYSKAYRMNDTETEDEIHSFIDNFGTIAPRLEGGLELKFREQWMIDKLLK